MPFLEIVIFMPSAFTLADTSTVYDSAFKSFRSANAEKSEISGLSSAIPEMRCLSSDFFCTSNPLAVKSMIAVPWW